MTTREDTAVARRSRQASGVVAPTTRVNLALPFSKITVEEPGRELAELTAIVAGLAAAVERGLAEPELPELRKSADALVARLRQLPTWRDYLWLETRSWKPRRARRRRPGAAGPPAASSRWWQARSCC